MYKHAINMTKRGGGALEAERRSCAVGPPQPLANVTLVRGWLMVVAQFSQCGLKHSCLVPPAVEF